MQTLLASSTSDEDFKVQRTWAEPLGQLAAYFMQIIPGNDWLIDWCYASHTTKGGDLNPRQLRFYPRRKSWLRNWLPASSGLPRIIPHSRNLFRRTDCSLFLLFNTSLFLVLFLYSILLASLVIYFILFILSASRSLYFSISLSLS